MSRFWLRLSFIFFCAFSLNLAWEHWHSLLYVHYRSGPISEAVLFHATLVDALLISGVWLATVQFWPRVRQPWLGATLLLALSVAIERWALATNRWAYAPLQPIVPLLEVGLTPTVQLAILFVLCVKLCEKFLPPA